MQDGRINKSINADLNGIAFEKLYVLLLKQDGEANWSQVYSLLCRQFSIDKPTVRAVIRKLQTEHPELQISCRGISLPITNKMEVKA